jgi:hypothetical protein
MTELECATPTPLAALLDYWAGDAGADADRIEEHAFECSECSRRLAAVAELAQGIARVAAVRGGIAMVLTQALVDRLAADGVKMRHYRVDPGHSVQCSIGADDDLSITYLSADLRDVQRVNVVSFAHGQEWARIEDAPIDVATGRVIFSVGGDLARTFPAITVRVELQACERDGSTRLLGAYTFQHTP